MAGNTRFRGFGDDNTLHFERWGGEAQVKVDDATHEKLMTMCRRQLPTRPPEVDPRNTTCTFNPSTGALDFALDAPDARIVLDLLEIDPTASRTKLADMLRAALENRNKYFDLEEPGVTNEP